MGNVLTGSTLPGGAPGEFLPLSGGTLSGNVQIRSASAPSLDLDQTGNNTRFNIRNNGLYAALDFYDVAGSELNYHGLRLRNAKDTGTVTAQKLQLARGYNGSGYLYDIYGKHNISTLVNDLGGKAVPFSYVGTGTYGVNNPNSLTFDAVPKFVFLFACVNVHDDGSRFTTDTLTGGDYAELIMVPEYLTTTYVGGNGFSTGSSTTPYAKKSADGKTLYWYCTKGESYQCNSAGSIYYGAAFF